MFLAMIIIIKVTLLELIVQPGLVNSLLLAMELQLFDL